MKQEHEKQLTEMLGVNPIMIDSQLVSGALRKRLYWTNIPNVTQPIDKCVELNDVLENGYCNMRKARTLLESDSRPLKTPVKMFHRYQKFNTVIFKDEDHYIRCKKHYEENFKHDGKLIFPIIFIFLN
jgi:DNA (cytosine-5)-methyltransferase 3A